MLKSGLTRSTKCAVSYLTRPNGSARPGSRSSLRGMWQEVKARMSGGYEDASALRLLDEETRPVHAFNPLVQIESAVAEEAEV